MRSHSRGSRYGLILLVILALLVAAGKFLGSSQKTLNFDFSKNIGFETENNPLQKVVKKALEGKDGSYAVYIESLKDGEKYGYNEISVFPAASLYKLVLLAAVHKEIEAGSIKTGDMLSASKTHLADVMGEVDYGYEDWPEMIGYPVSEALERVGRISDNFAAILLTEKLRQVRVARTDGSEQDPSSNGLLVRMTRDLGMKNTSFISDPVVTTALDIATYFKALYRGEVVSNEASQQISDLLYLSKINNRIPAKLPPEVKVVHKTGELAGIRHDAGVVYLENNPYIIVLLSQDLKYEDDGVETLAQISRNVYEYFSKKLAE